MQNKFRNYCLVAMLLAGSQARCMIKVDESSAQKFISILSTEYTNLCPSQQAGEPILFPTKEQIEQELYNIKLTRLRKIIDEGGWELEHFIKEKQLSDHLSYEFKDELNPQNSPMLYGFFEALSKKFGVNDFQRIYIVFDPLKKIVPPIAYGPDYNEDQTKLGTLYIPSLFLTEQENSSVLFEYIVRQIAIHKKLVNMFEPFNLEIAPMVFNAVSTFISLSLCQGQDSSALKNILISSFAWEILQERISLNAYLNNSDERKRLLSQIVSEIETNKLDPASIAFYNGALFPCLVDRDYLQQSFKELKLILNILDATDKTAAVISETKNLLSFQQLEVQ